MEEADVVRIVKSSIAKKNESLLASMKLMLESSLTDLKRSHAETADSHLSEIKKLNSLIKFTLPLRKVRSFCQRGKSKFFCPISPTLDGL